MAYRLSYRGGANGVSPSAGRPILIRPRALSAAIGLAASAPAHAFHGPEDHLALTIALVVALIVAWLLGWLAWRTRRLHRRLRDKHRALERTADRLAESEALHRLLTENSGDVIWMFDLHGMRLEYVSPSVERLRGYTPEEVLAAPWSAWVSPQAAPRMRALLEDRTQRILNGDLSAIHSIDEFDMPVKGGGFIATEIVSTILLDPSGRPEKVLGVTRDISRRKFTEAELRTRLAAIEVAGDAFIITDRNGVVQYANAATRRHTGYSPEELRGQHTRIFSSGRQSREFYAELWSTLRAGRVWRGELINRRKDGTLYDEEMTIAPVRNDQGEIEHFAAVKRDVSEQHRIERELHAANRRLSEQLEEIRQLQRQLAEQATRDPLTGLHNRRYLDEHLPEAFARAQREGYPLTIAVIDVDRFKRINDTYGHAAGDEVIKALANHLRASVRDYDVCCRYGGEEFLLLLPHTAPQVARERLETLRRAFAELPVQHGALQIQATLSIGYASYPEHANKADELIGRADIALYRAKRGGRDRVESADKRLRGESDAPQAIDPIVRRKRVSE